MRGKLITFEGCEGCGKSTQVKLLKEYLDKTNQQYVISREPGGTPISEQIRSVILAKENVEMVDECEALLYAASRCQLLKTVVIPAIEDGKIVVIDRFLDSSLAYQAYARGLGYDFVAAANKFAIDNCMPDLTVFIDVDPDFAFKRKGGADASDRVELAGMDFHRKVYSGYKSVIDKFPERFASIDGKGTIEEIHQKIISLLRELGYIQ